MKKRIALSLLCSLILSLFAGCSDVASGGISEVITSNSIPEEFCKSATIEETTIYDENDILIKATDLTFSSYAVEIGVIIENNSEQDYSFHSGYEHVVVNGYTIEDGYLWTDVAAGKKSKESISISFDELMLLGIYDIYELAIAFEIQDSNYDSVYIEPVTIPVSNNADSIAAVAYQDNIQNHSVQSKYSYTVEHFSSDTIYDCNDISIISQCVIINQYDNPILLLEFESRSSVPVYARITNVCVNGLVVYGNNNWSSHMIWPGTKRIVSLDLSDFLGDSYWEIYGVEEISSIGVGIKLANIEYDTIEDTTIVTVNIPGVDAAYDPSGEIIFGNDDVDIIFKAVIDGDDYDDGVYILLLAENKGSKTIILSEEYNTFSINGYMSDCSMRSIGLEPGQSGMIEIYIYDYMFEDSGITCAADIESFEIEFEVNNSNYHELYTIIAEYP